MQADTVAKDVDVLGKLNTGYIDSVQRSNVRWFEKNLAEDFLNSNPDCSLVDREGFLDQVGRPAPFTNLRAEDVRIRVLGDVAIIHARTRYTWADGRDASGRYTDIWARRGGQWVCVAAQVVRG
ncbi:MAG TPA: nuclear transport factor 2 family protein [Burkholderiales bacterium]|nr:nuclear transport factor 2 family protein [Burkholderiales bacterium]